MKILMATMTATGHINPGVPIARRLVERGHDVRWYTSPRYRRMIEATGADFLPLKVGVDVDEATVSDQYPEREKLRGISQIKWDIKNFVLDSTPGYVDDLTEILHDYPADVVVCDIGMPAGLFVSEREGLLCAAYNPLPLAVSSRDTGPFGLGLPPSSSMLGRLRNQSLNWLIWRMILRDVNVHTNRVRARIGLPPMKETFFDMMARCSHLYLQSGTPVFEYPRSDLPEQVHFIGPLLPDPPADFVQPRWWPDVQMDRPVILVTQGTVATDPRDVLLPAIHGLAEEDVLVIATTGNQPVERIGIDPLPANVRVEPFIPYAFLMPYVDVMVTNGGYGGILMALAHGIPLVGAGQTEDKSEVCQRIAWSRVGINLKAKSPTPEQVRRAVKAILTDSKYKERAAAIQKDFARYDAPVRAAELLEGLVARDRVAPANAREHTTRSV